MIERIERVENLGCLRSLAWDPGLGAAGAVVGVYGENGAGKSTLVCALRAAHQRDADLIAERRTLPDRGEPVVQLLTSAGMVGFRDGAWHGRLPPLLVFDRAFVNTHVYEGRAIGPDQRAGLYRIALGSGEAQAARAVDEAKGRLAEATKEVRGVVKGLEARCAAVGVSLEELRAAEPLAENPDLARDEGRHRELEARSDLDSLPPIEPLPAIPGLRPDGLRQLLDQTAVSMSEEALAAVRAHLESHLDHQGEAWLRQGVAYARPSADCPWCGQPLAGSRLAELLPTFFDEGYQRLRVRILRALERLAAWDAWAAALRATERENQRAHGAWSALVSLDEPPDLAELPQRAEALVAVLRSLVEEKEARLLDPLGADPRVNELVRAHRALLEPVATYNAWANGATARCRDLRADLDGERLRLRERIRRAQVGLLVAQPAVQVELRALGEAEATAARLTADKDRAEGALKARESERSATFLGLVNQVLQEFGAGFRLRELVGRASSRRVMADFHIELVHGGKVRASSKRRRQPRFDTLLSDGDRTTLALAVFLAQCLERPDPERVVLLDDPLAHLDRLRREVVARYLERLRATSAQVWLLSHDEAFLRAALPAGATSLALVSGPQGSTLQRWEDRSRE